MTAHTSVFLAGGRPSRLGGSARPVFAAKVVPSVSRVDLRMGETVSGGDGRVTGVVRTKGSPTNPPIRALVRLYRDFDGAFVGQTWSDATTGAYTFNWVAMGYRYTAVAYHTEHQLRAAAADNLTPERIPA